MTPRDDYPEGEWVVGIISRKLHGCVIVNADVFVHKSKYVGSKDIKSWFTSLETGGEIELQVEAHAEVCVTHIHRFPNTTN